MSSPYGAPAAGGVVTTTLVTLGVLPVLYVVVHRWGLPRADRDDDSIEHP